jgi:subtilisin family serine protease
LAKPELYGPDGVTGTTYAAFYGSSAAAPYVAGALALLRSADPQITVSRCLEILRETATTATEDCDNPVYAIDVLKAVQQLLGE